ncbi:MAG: B-box zinc finger protein [Thermoanaerobaculia bacterium]|nr:B-box zinc finger protein [Thermoanaerobaculia bacterium]
MSACDAHPGQLATHRCERGCGKLLCADCIRRGHRLLMCGHCGEMAVPLEAAGPVGGGPAAAPAVRPVFERRAEAEARARAVPYGFADAVLYPFRGDGGKSFWALLGLYAAFDVATFIVPLLALPLSIFTFAITLMVPALLFAITRTTSNGDNELPDWPDWDPWDRMLDAVTYLVGIVICALPGSLLLKVSGLGLGSFVDPETLPKLLFLLAVAFFLGVVLAVPVLGATAVYDQRSAIFRLDLHALALMVSPAEVVGIAAAISALLVGSTFVRLILAFVPLVGGLASTALGMYTSYLAAHLIGLYFRRHDPKMDRIYLGR